jgi:SAM-dependent methyltransferase
MKQLINVFTKLHKRTSRDYAGRMADGKVECMTVASRFGFDYWDGDRRFGYGGYHYDGRWEPAARNLLEIYTLPQGAKVLDVGCGKAFLLYEIKKLRPDIQVTGFDISAYAIANAKDEIRQKLFVHKAQDEFPFADLAFDLVISLNTLHNLPIFDLKAALREMERVGQKKYLVVESYRNDAELYNLQCWALTCRAFFNPEEWQWLFGEFGYSGDYEFIFFE